MTVEDATNCTKKEGEEHDEKNISKRKVETVLIKVYPSKRGERKENRPEEWKSNMIAPKKGRRTIIRWKRKKQLRNTSLKNGGPGTRGEVDTVSKVVA